MSFPIYLDYMATTPLDPRVAKKMARYLKHKANFGNPSSQHAYGAQTKEVVEIARQQVADLLNAEPREIIWTSGATEADNLAIKGAAFFYSRKGRHIVTCQTEHKAVLDTCAFLETQGFEVTYLAPEVNGLIDLQKLKASLREDTILISVMHVNNEIGVIQDIQAIGELARQKGIIFHVDAAQSAGKISIDVKKIPVDLMSLSAHKVYGPKGIGALFVSQNPRIHLQPLIHGGGHEKGLRSGTLPVHQIVGMGEAFRLAKLEMLKESKKILELRECLWKGIRQIKEVYLNGDFIQRVPGNLNVSFGGIKGKSLLLALLKNLAVSASSACTSVSMEPSYVLIALGQSHLLAQSSIRFSFGRFTTKKEIDFAIKTVRCTVDELRTMS